MFMFQFSLSHKTLLVNHVFNGASDKLSSLSRCLIVIELNYLKWSIYC